MLLRLSGRAPDGLMTVCRGWLAQGELGDLARTLMFWLVSNDVPVTRSDMAVMADLLTEADADAGQAVLSQIAVYDAEVFPFFAFAREIPPDLGASRVTAPASGAASKSRSAQTAAKVDKAAVQAITAEPGAIGLWRAWRFPVDGAPWPPPKRVFVAEVGTDVDEISVCQRIQEQLTSAREADPQVEVYQSGYQLPLYTELARTYGELLWAATEDPGIQIAPAFDGTGPDGAPSFSPDHLRLEEDEAAKVADYLHRGDQVLVTSAQMDDILDSARHNCVPLGFRTDGTWIWVEATAYYAQVHRLAPDDGLLAHIRSQDYLPPGVDGVGLHRATQVLELSALQEPAWILGEAGLPQADRSAEAGF